MGRPKDTVPADLTPGKALTFSSIASWNALIWASFWYFVSGSSRFMVNTFSGLKPGLTANRYRKLSINSTAETSRTTVRASSPTTKIFRALPKRPPERRAVPDSFSAATESRRDA